MHSDQDHKLLSIIFTGKSLSEALILTHNMTTECFTELQVQYMKIPSSEHGENMLCTKIVFGIENNLCVQLVIFMYVLRL